MQHRMFGGPRFQRVGYLYEVFDGNRTKNSPELFEDDRGREYVGKRARRNHPLLIVNEYLGASLADAIGLFTPEFELAVIRNRKYFLSRYWPGKDLRIFGNHELKERLGDWQELLLLLCLDLLIVNRDRHRENIHFCLTDRRYRVCAIDHDQALFGESTGLDYLNAKHEQTCYNIVHGQQVELIQSLDPTREDFMPCFERCHNLSDTTIREIINNLDEDYLAADKKGRVYDVLCRRRDTIESCVAAVMKSGHIHSFATSS